MTPIEVVLCKATSVTAKEGEDRQSYLTRIAAEAMEISQDEWEALPNKAQIWVNSAGEAYETGESLPDFPDLEEDDGTKPSTIIPGAPTKKSEKKIDKKIRARESLRAYDRARKKKKRTEKQKEKAKKDRLKLNKMKSLPESGIKVRIKKLILLNPTASPDDIADALRKAGVTPSMQTVKGIRSEFRHSLKVLIQEGLINLDLYGNIKSRKKRVSKDADPSFGAEED